MTARADISSPREIRRAAPRRVPSEDPSDIASGVRTPRRSRLRLPLLRLRGSCGEVALAHRDGRRCLVANVSAHPSDEAVGGLGHDGAAAMKKLRRPSVRSTPRRRAERAALRRRADALFARIVRWRGRCERCGRTERLQTHHIVSRRYLAVRYDEENALCLDGCHRWFHAYPLEAMAWLESRWPGRYDAIVRRANDPPEDLHATIARLETRLTELLRT